MLRTFVFAAVALNAFVNSVFDIGHSFFDFSSVGFRGKIECGENFGNVDFLRTVLAIKTRGASDKTQAVICLFCSGKIFHFLFVYRKRSVFIGIFDVFFNLSDITHAAENNRNFGVIPNV